MHQALRCLKSEIVVLAALEALQKSTIPARPHQPTNWPITSPPTFSTRTCIHFRSKRLPTTDRTRSPSPTRTTLTPRSIAGHLHNSDNNHEPACSPVRPRARRQQQHAPGPPDDPDQHANTRLLLLNHHHLPLRRQRQTQQQRKRLPNLRRRETHPAQQAPQLLLRRPQQQQQ